ncbi:MAG TPA: PAS domain S-box protein [Chthoniobacteraceae bacterium]|jgi:PAS domain S-box-containing protein|nr:PAS domain S-box protein [Chthoniobacteraceae bacterium]
MPRPLRVLLVEDRPSDAELVVLALRRAGFAPEWQRVETEAAFAAGLHPDLDLILSDYALPEFSGLRALEVLRESGLELPFIIVSGTIGEETAVAAMKKGASDYLLKDRLARLGPAVEHALEQARFRRERRESEAALRESEERFRQVAENIQDVFWLTDLEKQQMVYVSPAYEKIWGRSRGEIYASPQSWLEAIHPEDRARIYQAATTKQAEGLYDEEYRIIHPDGSLRWIRDRAFPVLDTRGRVSRVAGVARDVTARKQVDEALRESERRFREMLENVELIAMTLDRRGIVTFCNDHLLKTTGWSREEVLGADWFSKFLPENSEAERIFFATIEAGKIPAHYENTIKTRPGQLRDIVWNNTMLRDGAGNIVGTASIGEDVTERRLAEERVREQAAMLDHAHEAIIVREIHTGRITFWNQGAERVYGYGAAEAMGREIGELICVEPEIQQEITRKLLEQGEWHGERKHLSKAGRILTVSSHATLVCDAKGRPKSALVINIDVTEQKSLQEQFLRAQRLEGIGTLASGVAHDLNNILSPILMSVPLLEQALAGTRSASLVSIIEQSARRGTAIVRQVLTFARGVEGERMCVQVHHLLREMEKMAGQTFPRSITIRNTAPANLWPVIGDATQLQQVLLNFCVNARDAMPTGGTLTLHAENLQIDASFAAMSPGAKPGPYLLIAVSDTGEGIPPEIVQKIFDPFFTTKEVGKGTGLGLSTVLGIVKSHGGFVSVDSAPGQGAVFKVFLPADPGAAEAEAPPETVAPGGHGELILVVDDESSIRTVAETVLQGRGYRVLLAADGPEALALFAQHSAEIAAVLTDLAMPFLDGPTLIRALRKMKPGLPVIVSTGQGEKARISDLAVEVFLNKPYGADTLLRALHWAIDPAAMRQP